MSKICRAERLRRKIHVLKKEPWRQTAMQARRPIATFVQDEQGNIQRCLHCEKAECDNCLGAPPEQKKKKVEIPFGYDGFPRRLLDAYIEAESNYQLIELLLSTKDRVNKYRKIYGLPLPSALTRQERAELVAKIRGEEVI